MGTALINKSNSLPDRTGILAKDLKVGIFDKKETIFTLPKGLTVKDASPRGLDAIDRFEPYRFTIEVSTDDNNLIDYSNPLKRHEFGNLYSAVIKK